MPFRIGTALLRLAAWPQWLLGWLAWLTRLSPLCAQVLQTLICHADEHPRLYRIRSRAAAGARQHRSGPSSVPCKMEDIRVRRRRGRCGRTGGGASGRLVGAAEPGGAAGGARGERGAQVAATSSQPAATRTGVAANWGWVLSRECGDGAGSAGPRFAREAARSESIAQGNRPFHIFKQRKNTTATTTLIRDSRGSPCSGLQLTSFTLLHSPPRPAHPLPHPSPCCRVPPNPPPLPLC